MKKFIIIISLIIVLCSCMNSEAAQNREIYVKQSEVKTDNLYSYGREREFLYTMFYTSLITTTNILFVAGGGNWSYQE